MTIHTSPRPGWTISASYDDIRVEGLVLCVDDQKRLIVLQTPSPSVGNGPVMGKRDTYDILILRSEHLREVKTIKEGPAPPCPELNIHKIEERILLNERIQQEKLKFYRPDVPPEARELAERLEKTLTGVVWDQPNIVVMEHTVISPPYKVDNVTCNADTPQAKQQADYVQKIVSRFHQDRVRSSAAEK